MTAQDERLENVKRGFVLGDFSVEDLEDEVERILADPPWFDPMSPFAAEGVSRRDDD